MSCNVGPTQLPLQPRRGQLANFQLDAVSRGLAMIDAYGGYYIGDAEGFGKTFIGTELQHQMRVSYPNYGLPLILCPAGLILMWRKMNQGNGLEAIAFGGSYCSRQSPTTPLPTETHAQFAVPTAFAHPTGQNPELSH